MNKILAPFFAAIIFPVYGFSASLNSMTKQQIIKDIMNRTLVSIGVDNLNGKTVNNSNSVYMDNDGIAYGKMGHRPSNLPQYDTGTYTVNDSGVIHIKWHKWDDSKNLCFNLYQAKNAYITIDCNGVYHSTFMKADIKAGNQIKSENGAD